MEEVIYDYPPHKHPHSPEQTRKNDQRIWLCEECGHVFTDPEIKADVKQGWGHTCKQGCLKKKQRCESHLEPYIPNIRVLK